jgi:hypothetical protein
MMHNFRVFRFPSYVHIDVSLRKKFGDKSRKGVLVGYAFDSHAWLVYNPTPRRVRSSNSIVFDERWLDSSICLTPHVMMMRMSIKPFPLMLPLRTLKLLPKLKSWL